VKYRVRRVNKSLYSIMSSIYFYLVEILTSTKTIVIMALHIVNDFTSGRTGSTRCPEKGGTLFSTITFAIHWRF